MNWSVVLPLTLGLISLVAGGELLVRGASRLASTLGIPSVIIGLTVVAFGTSTPELAVSLEAAISGNADIAVANVVGSNIFNILLILGISSLISPLVIHSQMISREVPVMIGSALLLGIFALNGKIGRWEGIGLFCCLLFYTGWLVFEAIQKKREDRELLHEGEKEFPKIPSSLKVVFSSVALLVVGLGIIMYGAGVLVEGAIALASSLGVSDTVIGLTIVAAGTSLPEVVASVMATIKGERDIAVGNVVGSNIYNILGILGIAGGVSGLKIDPHLMNFDIPFCIFISILCWISFRRARILSRPEGIIYLALYLAYNVFIIQRAAS